MNRSSRSPKVWVKICGLSTIETLRVAVTAGADAVGFVFAPGSVRTVSADTARELSDQVPAGIERVGVFRNQPIAEVLHLAKSANLTTVQLHGAEPDEDFDSLHESGLKTIQALAIADLNSGARSVAATADLLLLDSETPGSGHRPPSLSVSLDVPWILAGGLTPDNVASAVADYHPWGVDVSSGVESARGVKDPSLIESFVRAARSTS